MEITFLNQAYTFCISLACGAVLCLIYDIFRILRLSVKPSKVSVFIQDILYWVICGLITFCLMIVRCTGEVRGFALIGELFGWIACRFTASRFIICISAAVIGFIKKVLNRIKRVVVRPILLIVKKFMRFIAKLASNIQKNMKKHLKRLMSLVYNQHIIRRGKKAPADNQNDLF